ncbi:MAG: DUF2905 domain-containing protein [Dialister sp.]|nr:DUF2905 domain-containing protein [Dialister sp.]
MGRLFIVFGAVLIAVGLCIQLGIQMPFLGHLPGDIHISKGNTHIYFPIVSCIVASIVISLLLNLFTRK